MNNSRPLFTLAALLLAPAASAQTATVPRDAKFEASFTVPNAAGNPFDPADNDVEVVFAGPAGAKTIQPAFWDGDRWRVRFAPTTPGTYTLSVLRNGVAAAPVNLSPAQFLCVSSNNPGFVRRDPKVVQRFIFDNGHTYYPLGMDAAWLGSGQTYDALFTKMSGASMNWARIWMNHWDGKNLDWAQDKANNPKPGTLLLDVARRWDTILDSAEKHGIYVQMTLQHHGQYTAKTDSNWAENPANSANGGGLQKPDDFFTDPEARRLARLKYRYITARYGYSTHLLSYELFNEVQNIVEAQSHFADVVNWHKEMASAIRSSDVNHHPLTTSNSVPGDPLAQIGLDYDQVHIYTPDIISFFAGLRGTNAPVFVGEWGPTTSGAGITEAFVHDGLWASVMAPTAGAGQFWYGDAVEKNAWWPQFASVTGFVRMAGPGAGLPARTVRVKSSGDAGDLAFAPSSGWAAFTRDTVTLPPPGAAPDLSGLGGYFQGSFHRDMMPRPITFLVNAPQPCEFRVVLGTIAKAGAHLTLSANTLSANGRPPVEADFPAASADYDARQTVSVSLPAGPSRVIVSSVGQDWFTVSRFVVTHYAPPIAVLARGDSHAVLFWAYTKDRAAAASPAALTLPNMTPGTYTVRLWDTGAGAPLAARTLKAPGGRVSIPLPAFAHDIAGSVRPAP